MQHTFRVYMGYFTNVVVIFLCGEGYIICVVCCYLLCAAGLMHLLLPYGVNNKAKVKEMNSSVIKSNKKTTVIGKKKKTKTK